MKSHTKTTTKKFPKALLIGGVIVLFIAAYAVTAHAAKLWPFNTSTPAQPNQTTSTSTTTQTQQPATTATDGTSAAQSTTTSAKSPQTTTNSTQPSSGAITITAASQNGDTLQIRGLIAGVENSGTCTLTLTKGSSTPITLTSAIQAESSSSTCQGFDVSISGQGMSTGTWNIALSFTSGTTQGSTSGEVTIR